VRHATVAEKHGAVEQSLGQIEVMCRNNDDRAGIAQHLQSLHERCGRRIVETGERFVEQGETRIVDQRALERDALTHAARKAAHLIVGTIGEAGAFERSQGGAIRVADVVESGKECEVLACGQFRVQEEVVSEDPDPAAELRCAFVSDMKVERAEANAAARRTHQRRQQRQHCRFAGAVGTEQSENLAATDCEGDTRQRSTPAEMARHVVDDDFVEVERRVQFTRRRPRRLRAVRPPLRPARRKWPRGPPAIVAGVRRGDRR
jgi:hypothetical protein